VTRPGVSPTFATLLQDFFLQGLSTQKGASPRTIESYRDTFRLLLAYAQRRLKKPPVHLVLGDLDPPFLLGFLDHLEKQRGNSVRTRNARLTAVRSFLHYASSRDVMELPVLQRSLAIPMKRYDKPLLGFLSRSEMDAVLAAPDRSTWSGDRDFVLLSVAYNTGARVSEILGLNVEDVELDRGRWIRVLGKGRKQRQVPLWKSTTTLLKHWLARRGGPPPRSRLSESTWTTTDPFGSREASARRRQSSLDDLPFARESKDLAAYPEAHDCHAPVASGGRSQLHRALVGSRQPKHDAHLRRGGPGDEGADLEKLAPPSGRSHRFPRRRQAARLPEQPVRAFRTHAVTTLTPAAATHGAEPSLPMVAPPQSRAPVQSACGRARELPRIVRRWASPPRSGRGATRSPARLPRCGWA